MSTKPSFRRESIIEKARINKIIYEYLLANPIPGGSMVYPSGSGIPIVVSGTSWGTTITDNSTNWNTAYSWGDHAGLYRPITYVPAHGALTGLGDDDHTQYYNQTRGDARYSLSGHTHAESTITFTDITTGNATTLLHGYLPKLGGGTTNFLRADGTWAAPAGGSGLTQQQIEGLI